MAGETTASACLGFLTVVDLTPHGLMGGYLLLNLAGRPLEFHCTAPVNPSRAQQILYGPTLEPFLYGEQIGSTLVRKATQPPVVLFVDQKSALAVREHIEIPTGLVFGELIAERSNAPLHSGNITIGRRQISTTSRFSSDREIIGARLAALDELFDLAEPFGRIREAIAEAQRMTAKAA
ncbi:MAG TPA: hypothetical protein VGI75_09400 [Pirellulales bacterium]|jgi:hypothetical protein